jgi:hypothetical protein
MKNPDAKTKLALDKNTLRRLGVRTRLKTGAVGPSFLCPSTECASHNCNPLTNVTCVCTPEPDPFRSVGCGHAME